MVMHSRDAILALLYMLLLQGQFELFNDKFVLSDLTK